MTLKDKAWRRIRVEISPDEGGAGSSIEPFRAPSLAGFGIPTPYSLTGMALSYQIAQKVHAASDPHDPPVFVNERARDVVDLILLHNLVARTTQPSFSNIRLAILDIFDARASEAKMLNRPERLWPARVTALPHWGDDFNRARESAGIKLSLIDAIAQVNHWLDEIDGSAS